MSFATSVGLRPNDQCARVRAPVAIYGADGDKGCLSFSLIQHLNIVVVKIAAVKE